MRTFQTHLRQAIDLRGETVKGLARKWRPESVEPARRMIQKYLSGAVVPTRETRDELAAALNVPATMLPISEGQEQLLADLMAEVQRLSAVQQQILERVA